MERVRTPVRVDIANLTDAESQALARYARNRLAENEFHEATNRLQAATQSPGKISVRPSPEEKEQHARTWLEALEAGHRAGRIQEPALFFLKVYTVEQVHDDRMTRPPTDPRMKALDEESDRIRRERGLDDGEYWPIGEGPPEWEALCASHDACCDALFFLALQEFGLNDEAQLLQDNRAEFDHRRELGRRTMHKGLTELERLDLLQIRFIEEAVASARVGAFQAAAAMVGAALEALLLAKCLASVDDACIAAQQLPRKTRPKNMRDPRAWRFVDMCRVAEEAGWLPRFQVGDFELSGETLANLVRENRNLLHPEKQLREGAERVMGTMIVRNHYDDTLASYELLLRHIAVQQRP